MRGLRRFAVWCAMWCAGLGTLRAIRHWRSTRGGDGRPSPHVTHRRRPSGKPWRWRGAARTRSLASAPFFCAHNPRGPLRCLASRRLFIAAAPRSGFRERPTSTAAPAHDAAACRLAAAGGGISGRRAVPVLREQDSPMRGGRDQWSAAGCVRGARRQGGQRRRVRCPQAAADCGGGRQHRAVQRLGSVRK